MYQKIDQAANYLRRFFKITPAAVVVVGDGFFDFSKEMQIPTAIRYQDIPFFPVNENNKNKALIYGIFEGRYIVLMQDRPHKYEGFSYEDIAFPFQVFSTLGIPNVILTGVGGTLNEKINEDSFLLLRDHISIFASNLFEGVLVPRLGNQFADMSNVYNYQLRQKIMEEANKTTIDVKEGIYCYLPGPNFETKSDARILKALGADAVGMEMVPEASFAHYVGLNVIGIVLITHQAANLSNKTLVHRNILRACEKNKVQTEFMVRTAIQVLPKE